MDKKRGFCVFFVCLLCLTIVHKSVIIIVEEERQLKLNGQLERTKKMIREQRYTVSCKGWSNFITRIINEDQAVIDLEMMHHDVENISLVWFLLNILVKLPNEITHITLVICEGAPIRILKYNHFGSQV